MDKKRPGGVSFLSIIMILYGFVFEIILVSTYSLFGDWWLLGLILFVVGTPFAMASIILGIGLWKGKNWARIITIISIYFEITVVIIYVIGTNAIIPFSFQLFGVYGLIPIVYTMGKDIAGLYYLSKPNIKAYFGQITK